MNKVSRRTFARLAKAANEAIARDGLIHLKRLVGAIEEYETAIGEARQFLIATGHSSCRRPEEVAKDA